MDQTFSLLIGSPVGVMEICGSEEHIHSVHFTELEYSSPSDEHIPALLQLCATQLREYFDGKRKEFDLPLAQAGTDFQQSVWQQLLYIPYGKTISYLDLARNLNNEKSIRAVGSANGQNDIAIIVPCHRVIGADGKLVGYAGGLWRKKWLLQHEAKHTSQGLFSFE